MRIGPYEVVRELGRGGMGVVYAVADPEAPRLLALKLIQGARSDEVLARFRREAEALARVRHPNVLRVHELGQAREGPYLVTELLEGESLAAVVRRGALAPPRAARIVAELAGAAAALHRVGVLHRDLKPDNVLLVGEEERPVLLDFGVARDESAESLTATGQLLGTPSFMSPEQVNGDRRALGPWTDVYGLGAILFALLVGREPFEGPPLQVLRDVLLKEPRWPAAGPGGVPLALEAIGRRALAKDPAARYPDAEALGADLERLLRGEAPLAAALSAGGPWTRRGARTALAAATAAIVVAAILAGALAFPRGPRLPEARDAAPTVAGAGHGPDGPRPGDGPDGPAGPDDRPGADDPDASGDADGEGARPASPGDSGWVPAARAARGAARVPAVLVAADRYGGLFLDAGRLLTWRADALELWELTAEAVPAGTRATGGRAPAAPRLRERARWPLAFWVVAAAVDARGEVLLGGAHGELVLLRPVPGAPLRDLPGHGLSRVACLATSAGFVVVGGERGRGRRALALFSREPWDLAGAWPSRCSLAGVAVLPGEALLVAVTEEAAGSAKELPLEPRSLHVLSRADLPAVERAMKFIGRPTAVRVSPAAGAPVVAVGTGVGELQLVELARGERVVLSDPGVGSSAARLPGVLLAFAGTVGAVTFSHDGSLVYAGVGGRAPGHNGLVAWRVARPDRPQWAVRALDSVRSIEASPDGAWLLVTLERPEADASEAAAVGADTRVELWRLPPGG